MQKVSILIPCYNAGQNLLTAIPSVLNQSYRNIEVLVCDDGSTDESTDILIDFAARDERLKTYFNQVNKGISACRNFLINKSSGEYIAVMDADDLIHKDRITLQANFLDKNPDIDIVGSLNDLIINGKRVKGKKRVFHTTHKEIAQQLRYMPAMSHSTLFARRAVFKKVCYREEFYAAVDYDLQLKALSQGFRFGNLPLTLMSYRVHENSISSNKKKEQFICAFLAQKLYLERQRYKKEVTLFRLNEYKFDTLKPIDKIFVNASCALDRENPGWLNHKRMLQIIFAPMSEIGRFYLRRKLYHMQKLFIDRFARKSIKPEKENHA